MCVCVIRHSPAWLPLYKPPFILSFSPFRAPADQCSSLTLHRSPTTGHCVHSSSPQSHEFTGPIWKRNQDEFSLNWLTRGDFQSYVAVKESMKVVLQKNWKEWKYSVYSEQSTVKHLTDKQKENRPIADLNYCPLACRCQILPLHHCWLALPTLKTRYVTFRFTRKQTEKGSIKAAQQHQFPPIGLLRTTEFARKSMDSFEPVTAVSLVHFSPNVYLK